jgi:hypothetical protein
MNRATGTFDISWQYLRNIVAHRLHHAHGSNMTISAHLDTFIAHFIKVLSPLRWALVAGALAASAAPDVAAAQAARPGAFDGTWNVTFTPKAGNCHASNTVPFNVYGPRVSSAGGGKVSGGVTRKGDVTVRITVGASWADGRGRLAGNSGNGRWSGLITGDRCSGVWQANRS